MTYPKAEITTVKIGPLEFEGLLTVNETFGIAVPQLCSVFQILNKNAQRDLKAILGNDFQFLKWRTTLHPKAVNVLLLPAVERLIFELALKQNAKAIELSRALIGLSLHQLFCDAFNIHFEKEERAAWLETRLEGKIARRTWTDAVQEWLNNYSHLLTENERKFIWIHISNAVNKAVFNRASVKLRSDWKLNKSASIRDNFTDKELKLVEQIEDTAMRILDKHGKQVKPTQAIHLAAQGLYIPVQSR